MIANYNTNTESNTAMGYRALYSTTTGNYNVAFGAFAGWKNTLGSYNTYIGYGTDNNDYNADYVNSSAIGADAFITGSNRVKFGNINVTSIGGAVDFTVISDKRIKKDVQENVPGLSFIKMLKPVTYHVDLGLYDAIVKRAVLKDDNGKIIPPSEEQVLAQKMKEQVVYSGFLAQDVESAAKSLQYDFSGVDAPKNDNDVYGLRYAGFVVPLVKAVQELSTANENLQSLITDLKIQLTFILQQISDIIIVQKICCPSTVKEGN